MSAIQTRQFNNQWQNMQPLRGAFTTGATNLLSPTIAGAPTKSLIIDYILITPTAATPTFTLRLLQNGVVVSGNTNDLYTAYALSAATPFVAFSGVNNGSGIYLAGTGNAQSPGGDILSGLASAVTCNYFIIYRQEI